jgi:hypothetical protein
MSAYDTWLVAMVGTGMLVVLVALLWFRKSINELRSGTPIKDERTKYIQGRAALFALNTGLALLVALELCGIVATEFGGFPMLSAGYTVAASIILFGGTYLGMYLYLNRTGEPEE